MASLGSGIYKPWEDLNFLDDRTLILHAGIIFPYSFMPVAAKKRKKKALNLCKNNFKIRESAKNVKY